MERKTLAHVTSEMHSEVVIRLVPGALFLLFSILIVMTGSPPSFLLSIPILLACAYVIGLVTDSFTWPFISWAAGFWYRHDGRNSAVCEKMTWDSLLIHHLGGRAVGALPVLAQKSERESRSLASLAILFALLGCIVFSGRAVAWLGLLQAVENLDGPAPWYGLLLCGILLGVLLLGAAYWLLIRFRRRNWGIAVLWLWTLLFFTWISAGLMSAVVAFEPYMASYLVIRLGGPGYTLLGITFGLLAWLAASASFMLQRRRAWAVAACLPSAEAGRS